MIERVTIRRGAYYDSVTLMLVSRDVALRDGVEAATAVTATPLNLSLLEGQGYDLGATEGAGPNDLIVVVRADDAATADAALAEVEARLAGSAAHGGGSAEEAPPRSLRAAARRNPGLNLAFISVPGRHATYEAALALREGMHVFCFSDGVSVEDEVALKERALQRGLLFMGPDCGTGIIDGVALGFANVVTPGPVGLIGASGTGLQQVTCLLDAAGVGISHAIGVGGRDLSAAVGGRMTEHSLGVLAADPTTETIVVVSKPPDPAVAERIAGAAAICGKPVVLAFLGDRTLRARGAGVTAVDTLEAAAAAAAQLTGATPYVDETPLPAPHSGFVRGLFCGGTLCDEAMTLASARVGRIASNIPLEPEWWLADSAVSEGHTFIDFGDDAFTEGRAHPMIDPALRDARFAREAALADVGAILLDVVLGHGAHLDPAATLAPLVKEARDVRGDDLTVVVSLCGTEDDPQNLAAQRDHLEAAGAVVARSNAQATRIALAAVAASEVPA